MSTGDSRNQLDRHKALLGDPYQRDGLGDAGQDTLADHASLIEDHLQFDPASLQHRGDFAGAGPSANLLVMAVRKVNGPYGLEAFGEEHLHGFERAENSGLVVECAPPPDEPIDDSAAEGILLPFIHGTCLNGHHVHVANQQDRLERGVASLPGV
jgi:hypothetical protein